MIIPSRTLRSIIIITLTLNASINTTPLIDRITSLFRSYQHASTFEGEYPLAIPATLTVRNTAGPITVRTEWRSSVQLRAIKRAHQASTLEEINITETRPKGDNSLTLTTSINTDSDHEVSYELLVPAHVTLKLETRDGPIEVSDVNGSVIARTTRAPITIKNVTDTVIANTKESGSITIEHVTSFRATTDNGSITATQIAKDAVASATTGNVSVSLAKLSERGAIALHTGDGTVELKWLTPQGSTGRRKAINALLTGKKRKLSHIRPLHRIDRTNPQG